VVRPTNSSAHIALTGELVKTKNGLPLQELGFRGLKFQAIQFRPIAFGLALALVLTPLADAQPQQSSAQSQPSTQPPSQSTQAAPPTQTSASPSTRASQPVQASPSAARPDDDNAPVPPMPPDPNAAEAPVAAPFTADHSSDNLLPDSLPDSPGTVQSAQLENQQPAVTQQSAQSQPMAQPPAQPAVPPLPKEPLGTAAAETVPTMGVAASRPAGAALAPGKQRRIRTFLIRTGAIVGAAAALGVTMALTEASPSKPPGAH